MFREASQRGEISAIGRDKVVILRGFEDHRHSPQALIGEQGAKGVKPNGPLPDVLVPVNATAEPFLGVVQMNHFQVRDPHDRIERAKDTCISVRGPDVVACRKDMAGIQADARCSGRPI